MPPRRYQEVLDKFEDDFTDRRSARYRSRSSVWRFRTLRCVHNQLKPAVEWLEQVLDEFPDDPGANNDLGYLWADENQHLQRALRDDSARGRRRAGELRLSRQPGLGAVPPWADSEEALAELQKAAGSENPEGEVLDHLGEVYRKLGQDRGSQNRLEACRRGL